MPGAALHGKPGRLVEDEDLGVLVDQHLRQHVGIALLAHGARGHRALALLVDAERRHAHHLAGLDARVGLGAAAIDADLAGAQQLLQMAEAQAREMRLEPAIEPHARLAGFHRYLFDACHLVPTILSAAVQPRLRTNHNPAKSASREITTLPSGIGERLARRAPLPQHREIEREGGKGGEAAKDAGRDEQPQLVRRVEAARQAVR